MVTYKYTAMDRSGHPVKGIIEAFDEMDATVKIRNQYDTVTSLKQTHGLDGLSRFLNFEIGGDRLNPKAFTLMCNQFSTILAAGIPIARAVHLVADKSTDKMIKRILVAVADDVEAGRTMSSSFEEHGGDKLPPTFVETIRAGEEAGDVANAFDSIYRHFDKQTKMNDKVRGAMMYPIFVMCIAVVVVIVLMVKVVPAFTAIFEDLGGEMPFLTRLLIGISNFIRGTFVYFLIIAAVLFVAFMIFKTTETGKMALSRLQLQLPVLGNIAELNAASLYANTMATMIASGLSMTKSVA
ncbi:MAG: type II secretion system F family protein, partial [Lachnospiraceae bacterium]|nr:type II secretion system F family protein [Lachnospiraceae bacterium]